MITSKRTETRTKLTLLSAFFFATLAKACQKHWLAPKKYEIVKGQGAHGGGDVNLLGHLFGGVSEDPLGHAADFRAGANSIIVGIAANASMQTGRLIRVDDLIHF